MRQAPLAKAELITASAPKITIPQSQTATPAARAAQTAFAGQADGVNTARIMQDKAGNIIGGEFGFGNGVQRYDPKKIAWVMARGASGGSLSRADQAVYDRMMYLRAQKTAQEQQTAQEQKALDDAHAEDERKRRLDMQDWERQEKIRRAARNEDEIAREKRKAEADAAALAEERQYKAAQEQAALDAENAKYEALNKKYGIAEGTRLSDKDYNDLAAGRTKWGYSQRDQQAVDKINQSYEDSARSGSFTADELAKLREESDAKIAAYRKGVQPNDQPPTAEQLYNGSFAAPDGTRLIADGKGGLSAIPGTGPQKEVETPAEKNARVAQERKDKWLDDRIKILTSPRKGQVKDKFGNVTEGMVDGLSYQDAYDQAIKEMDIRFPSAPSVPAPAPQGTGSAPTPTPTPTPTATPTNDPRKKWAQYAD